MQKFMFWQRWLVVSGMAVVLFGIFMALLNWTELMQQIDKEVDPVFWGNIADNEGTVKFKQWIYGAWGSTIAGWGIIIAFVAAVPFKRKEKWAHASISAGLIVWYLLDTGISYYHQVYFNVALNTAFLIILGIPLLATAREFKKVV